MTIVLLLLNEELINMHSALFYGSFMTILLIFGQIYPMLREKLNSNNKSFDHQHKIDFIRCGKYGLGEK